MSYFYPPSNLCPETQMRSQQSWCRVRTSVPAPWICSAVPGGKTHRTQAPTTVCSCPSPFTLCRMSSQHLSPCEVKPAGTNGHKHRQLILRSLLLFFLLQSQTYRTVPQGNGDVVVLGNLTISLSWHSTNYTCNTRTQLIQEENHLSELLLFSAGILKKQFLTNNARAFLQYKHK